MSEKQTDHELPDHLTQPVIRAIERGKDLTAR